MARTDQSGDWAKKLAPSLSEIESISIEAFARLPEKFRSLCGENFILDVADFPEDHIIEDMGLESPFELLGLFEGNGLGELFSISSEKTENRIILFRRAILDHWAEGEETLADIITHVLICEIGYHLGLSEEDMEKLEEPDELQFLNYIVN